MSSLRLSDVNLDGGEIRVEIHKTKDLDHMPICAELDAELRRWLSVYESRCAPLRGEMYLVPARSWGARSRHDETGQFLKGLDYDTLAPMRPAQRLEEIAKGSLEAIAFPTRNPDGTSRGEGIHTLRRSGARALFDQLAGDGYDGALQEVKTWLHHANATMTEHYLGLQAERRKRDLRVKGQKMFVSQTGVAKLMVQ